MNLTTRRDEMYYWSAAFLIATLVSLVLAVSGA
jgi:hypothetical protein